MIRTINALITAAYFGLFAVGGHYGFQQVAGWVEEKALEKASQDLGSMEQIAQQMTGGELDY